MKTVNLRLLITFSGAVRKMFRTRVIFGGTVENYLFHTIKKQTTTAFLFQNLSQLLESRPLPTSANTKKAI